VRIIAPNGDTALLPPAADDDAVLPVTLLARTSTQLLSGFLAFSALTYVASAINGVGMEHVTFETSNHDAGDARSKSKGSS
jgi:hypothetical protein